MAYLPPPPSSEKKIITPDYNKVTLKNEISCRGKCIDWAFLCKCSTIGDSKVKRNKKISVKLNEICGFICCKDIVEKITSGLEKKIKKQKTTQIVCAQ